MKRERGKKKKRTHTLLVLLNIPLFLVTEKSTGKKKKLSNRVNLFHNNERKGKGYLFFYHDSEKGED